MKTIYFITGSQDLYGEETLKQVAANSKEMAKYFAERIQGVSVVWQPVVRNHEEAESVLTQATADRDCAIPLGL